MLLCFDIKSILFTIFLSQVTLGVGVYVGGGGLQEFYSEDNQPWFCSEFSKQLEDVCVCENGWMGWGVSALVGMSKEMSKLGDFFE